MPTSMLPSPPNSDPMASGTPAPGYEALDYGFPEVFNTMPTYTMPPANGLLPGSGPMGFGTPATGYEGPDYGFPEVFDTMPTSMMQLRVGVPPSSEPACHFHKMNPRLYSACGKAFKSIGASVNHIRKHDLLHGVTEAAHDVDVGNSHFIFTMQSTMPQILRGTKYTNPNGKRTLEYQYEPENGGEPFHNAL
ncbi:Uu.00g134390.m01.CDS01 [Anthostomella pinea]|uniref:Uu.00g134390.m01.CDS01 n=1 Tax=Anthostomella pinea TaxID=933095 RepID=A0AAI8VP07_9PEZI|nr:Uu.00g134390.m01.CDS01 [Anthostomella pinea]